MRIPSHRLLPGNVFRFTWAHGPEFLTLVSISARRFSMHGDGSTLRRLTCLTWNSSLVTVSVMDHTLVEVIA